MDGLLFDLNMYKNIDSEAKALSFIRYYSKNVNTFRGQLISMSTPPEQIERTINILWKRVIIGCMRFGIPLTKEGEVNAKRLGINY